MVRDFHKEAYGIMKKAASKAPSDESIVDMLWDISVPIGREMKMANIREGNLKMTLARIIAYSKKGKDISDLLIRAEDLLARMARIEDILR